MIAEKERAVERECVSVQRVCVVCVHMRTAIGAAERRNKGGTKRVRERNSSSAFLSVSLLMCLFDSDTHTHTHTHIHITLL